MFVSVVDSKDGLLSAVDLILCVLDILVNAPTSSCGALRIVFGMNLELLGTSLLDAYICTLIPRVT